MKTCPVCKTSLFDDMEVCYGCMYAFGSKPELEQRVSEQCVQEQQSQRPQQIPSQTPALQSMSPMVGWSVRLEMRNAADPSRSWSMELVPARSAPQPVAVGALRAAIA